jgi:hypothetical protein
LTVNVEVVNSIANETRRFIDTALGVIRSVTRLYEHGEQNLSPHINRQAKESQSDSKVREKQSVSN